MRRFLIGLLLFLAIAQSMSTVVAEQTAQAASKGQFLGAKPTEYPNWFKDSFLELDDDIREASDGGRHLLLLFHQDGCPYCNALVERNLSQKSIEDKLRSEFDVIAINIWGDREMLVAGEHSYTEKTFSQQLKVQFTPTLLFLDDQGQLALRLNGYIPPDRFKKALDFIASSSYKDQSFRDYLGGKTLAKASSTQSLNHQPFFADGPIDLSRIGNKQAIALFFEQADCPHCDGLHQGPLNDVLVQEAASRLHCVQLNLWSSADQLVMPDGRKISSRDLARQLNIKYAPTIVLMDRQGNEIIRNEAEFKSFHTQGIFDYASSGDYLQQPNFQRWLEARADKLLEQGEDVDIWR